MRLGSSEVNRFVLEDLFDNDLEAYMEYERKRKELIEETAVRVKEFSEKISEETDSWITNARAIFEEIDDLFIKNKG